MKVLVGSTCFAFMVCFCCNLYAQIAPSAIKGKILTETRTSAEGVTVVLLKYRDSTIVNSTITTKSGLYQFTGIPPDSYLLLVSNIGYSTFYTGPYQLVSGQSTNVPDIKLNASTNLLKEVSVVSSRPVIEVKPGKIILNIQGSTLSAGKSAFDILKDSPGVRVDNNNNISVVGRQNAMITIDGKPTNLTGDDLVGILRGMQSGTIDYIELITSGSAKYDASAGGIVNIVMKKGKNNGTNGSLNAMAGFGKYYKSSTGIAINSRNDQFNIFGNFDYSDNKSFHDFTLNRLINYNNVLSDYHIDYNSVSKINNAAFRLGADYFISANHTIGILIDGSSRTEDILKDNKLLISNQNILDSIITTNSDVDRRVTRINYNLNYNGKFSGGKTLSADFNYTTNNRSSSEYITNNFYNPTGGAYRSALLLQNLSPSDIPIYLSKIDFASPLSKTAKLEAGIKHSKVTSNNDLIFGPLKNGVYESDPTFTNHFLYTESVNYAYLNFEKQFSKLSLTTGLRAEQTTATGNSITAMHVVKNDYLDFFPQATLSYVYDDKRNFTLSYNRGIRRPDYQSINPFFYYIDLYDYTSGNPFLKPQYTNTFQFSFIYKKTINITLYSAVIKDAFDLNFYRQTDSTKKDIDTRVNFGKIYNYGIKFIAAATFTNWWNADFFADIAYQRYVAYPENGNLNKGTQDINFSNTHRFILGKTLSADVLFKYESPNFYGLNEYKTNYNIDFGISKQIFNKNGSLRLNATDIFNTKRDRSSTHYLNLNMMGMDKKESRVVRLVFTYRFGKTSMKTAGSRDTGNGEELKRTNSNN